MSDDAKEGLQAAVEAIDQGEPPAASEEQIEIFPPIALKPAAAPGEAPAIDRGPGRPKGARNKRTEQWVEYIEGRYRSPLIFLAETYSRTVEELAAELCCKREDAFKLQLQAAKELAPYLHQKLPIAVDVKGASAGVLLIGELTPGSQAALDAAAMGVDMQVVKVIENHEENQGDSDEDPAQSHDEQSHEGVK